LSDEFDRLWTGTGERNRAAFERVFRPIPNNSIRTWAEYTEYTKQAVGIRVSARHGRKAQAEHLIATSDLKADDDDVCSP
jgi:hypothetical protein